MRIRLKQRGHALPEPLHITCREGQAWASGALEFVTFRIGIKFAESYA
jgi:hypothetical protein